MDLRYGLEPNKLEFQTCSNVSKNKPCSLAPSKHHNCIIRIFMKWCVSIYKFDFSFMLFHNIFTRGWNIAQVPQAGSKNSTNWTFAFSFPTTKWIIPLEKFWLFLRHFVYFCDSLVLYIHILQQRIILIILTLISKLIFCFA